MTSPDVPPPTSDNQDLQDEALIGVLEENPERHRIRPLQVFAVLAVEVTKAKW